MKKITLFLLSLFCVFSLSVIAQESTPNCDSVSINLFDAWGDGGGSVTLGGVTATNAGSSSSTAACVDLSACNQVDYESTDFFPGENSWTITDLSLIHI